MRSAIHVPIFATTLTLVLASGFSVIPVAAQDNLLSDGVADLTQQLEGGLKARLPNEFEFIALIVRRIEERRFSTGEVKSVFQWARRKNKKVPFPYFERAMRIIAAKKNVPL